MTERRFWWQSRKLSAQEKGELIEKIAQDASYNEIHHYGCSQSVLDALQKNLDIGSMDVFKAASPLGGGCAGMGEICGAVIGGLMSIGLVCGREKFNDKVNAHNDPRYLECRDRGRYFCERFRREYGYLTCRDIRYQRRGGRYPFEESKISSTPEERTIRDKTHDKCGEVCTKAARLAAEAILDPTAARLAAEAMVDSRLL